MTSLSLDFPSVCSWETNTLAGYGYSNSELSLDKGKSTIKIFKNQTTISNPLSRFVQGQHAVDAEVFLLVYDQLLLLLHVENLLLLFSFTLTQVSSLQSRYVQASSLCFNTNMILYSIAVTRKCVWQLDGIWAVKCFCLAPLDHCKGAVNLFYVKPCDWVQNCLIWTLRMQWFA